MNRVSTFNGLLGGCRVCERRGFDGVTAQENTSLGEVPELSVGSPTKVVLGCVALIGFAHWWNKRARAKEQAAVKAAERAEES